MRLPRLPRFSIVASLAILVILRACGTGAGVASIERVTPTPVPTATTTPGPGRCDPQKFWHNSEYSGPEDGGPTLGFQYPPLTYWESIHYPMTYPLPPPTPTTVDLCSPGTPDSILAFMTNSVKTAAGWTITNTTFTSLTAVSPPSPSGSCVMIDIQVGVSGPDYPGDWTMTLHPPLRAPCLGPSWPGSS